VNSLIVAIMSGRGNHGGGGRNKRAKPDEGSWDCTVCTFHNTADAFKCLMCDTRKGTSTRKPKLNSHLEEQVEQVVRQLNQHQSKKPRLSALVRDSVPSPPSPPSPFSDTNFEPPPERERPSVGKGKGIGKGTKKGLGKKTAVVAPSPEPEEDEEPEDIEEQQPEQREDEEDPIEGKEREDEEVLNEEKTIKKKMTGKTGKKTNVDGKDKEKEIKEGKKGPIPKKLKVKNEKKDLKEKEGRKPKKIEQESTSSDIAEDTSSNSTSTQVEEKPVTKRRPHRLKNVDRSSAETMAVTVNNITVIITDFKPKTAIATAKVEADVKTEIKPEFKPEAQKSLLSKISSTISSAPTSKTEDEKKLDSL